MCLCGGSWNAAGRAGWTERGRLYGGQRRASEVSGREDGGNSSRAMLAAGACCYTALMTSEAPARPRARRKLQLPGERGWGGARGWMGCRSPGRDFPTARGAGCSGLGAQWGLQGRDGEGAGQRWGPRPPVLRVRPEAGVEAPLGKRLCRPAQTGRGEAVCLGTGGHSDEHPVAPSAGLEIGANSLLSEFRTCELRLKALGVWAQPWICPTPPRRASRNVMNGPAMSPGSPGSG